MHPLLTVCLLVLAPVVARGDAIRITGETKYKPHGLVRLKAEGVDPRAAILWRVHPSRNVERAASPRGTLEFAAHPGTYEVELLVITNTEGGLAVEEARVVVEIAGCSPAPPSPESPPPGAKPDPVAALGRIRFGNSGCTATVVGPRRPDGRWDVLTAAHCVSGTDQRGTLTLKDGRSLGLRVVAHDKTADVAWCVTEEQPSGLPHALVAAKNPDPGTTVWHMGFGTDKPGNREEGTVAERENGQGQLRLILNVSSGDSGGGIFRADTNELVAVVCCTSGMGRKVSMWGASAEAVRRARPKASEAEPGWVPMPVPIRKVGEAWLTIPFAAGHALR